MGETNAPHGGRLVDLLVTGAAAGALRETAQALPKIALTSRDLSDLELLTVGGYSPLQGFMTRADYLGVVNDMRLASGVAWPMPITLAVSAEQAASLKEGQDVALADDSGRVLAVLAIAEKYPYDRQLEARQVYRTEDEAHPGVAALYAQADVLLGGPVRVLEAPGHDDFPRYRLTPAQTRAECASRGWRTVVGFQTRNPVHRAHEYIQKCALEIVDGLLLHPLVGDTKSDDIPADVRMRCYEVLIENYYPADRVLLSVNPAAMRYAGPREAIFHALVRKNFGCTHFIVGRDHAGVGNYYGTFDAQRIFEEFAPGELGITPLMFDHTFFCRKCDEMASIKTCPHDAESRVTLSGTQVRDMLKGGIAPPIEFSRPEVARVLIEAMQERVTPHHAI
ncbi:MAG: sulfate adenylyltransferase [Dehalococcoidia bacterium]|nr:sulfate adenylyltransferase [Dehalococcoidia bacterium]